MTIGCYRYVEYCIINDPAHIDTDMILNHHATYIYIYTDRQPDRQTARQTDR